jgi:hypothetical protein
MTNHEMFSLAQVVTAQRNSLEVQRRALTIAWEHRRRTIERALHDGLQQQLLALRIELLRATRLQDPASVRTFAALAIAQIDATAAELRHLAAGGRLSVLDVGDLGAALRELAAHAALVVAVTAPTGIAIDGPVAEVLVFTVSEALANTLRYAPGAQVWIELQQQVDELVLTVRDNGPGGAAFVPGHGLDGLRRRVEALGGSFTLGTVEAVPAKRSDRGSRSTDKSLPGGVGNVLGLRFPNSSADPKGTKSPTPTAPTLDDPHRDGANNDVKSNVKSNVNSENVSRDVADRNGDRGAGSDFVGGASVSGETRGDRVNQELVFSATEERQSFVDPGDDERLSAALSRLRSELHRVTKQVELFEASLTARLTSVPVKELTEARNALVESNLVLVGANAFATAAAHVEQANERLREVVSQLRVAEASQDELSSGQTPIANALLTSLTNLANQRGVLFNLSIRSAPTLGGPSASKSVERIVEELIHDADPGSAVSLQLRVKSERLIGSISLSRLPSPLTVAFVNELVYTARGAWSVSSVGDHIQAKVELPCG